MEANKKFLKCIKSLALSVQLFSLFEHNSPYFPLLHLKLMSRAAWKPLIWTYFIFCVLVAHVVCVYLRIISAMSISIGCDMQVMTVSKCWTITTVIVNCINRLVERELVFVRKRKYEWLSRFIAAIFSVWTPYQRSESSNLFAELSLTNCQCAVGVGLRRWVWCRWFGRWRIVQGEGW